MFGNKIEHPPSTNFYRHDFPIPPSKRVKRCDSSHSESRASEDGEWSASLHPIDIAGCRDHDAGEGGEERAGEGEEEDGSDTAPRHSQPGLEISLPPVQNDEEAISEYEAYKASQSADSSLRGKIDDRSWSKGKSSIYVDAFNLALGAVLEEETHLFDEAERSLFTHWQELGYESQYLYVRLFLRKTSAWHRVNKLGYHSDIANLEAAITDLQKIRELPATNGERDGNPGEGEPPPGTTLAETFTFAECSEEHIKDLSEASSLLLLEELKIIAKEAKVQGKNKKKLLTALRSSSGKQSGLGFRGLRRSETGESTASNGITPGEEVEYDEDDNEAGDWMDVPPSLTNRDAHYTRRILDHTGRCIRLSLGPLKLFERVHLVFYRSTEWTEKSLTTIILAKISRRNFPQYLVSRSTTIFTTRALLLEFEASLRVQYKIDNILEFNGTPGRASLEQVKAIFEEVYPRWKTLLAEERAKEERLYESGEGAYLRRFNPAWVYTRIVHKGLHPLGRFKEHQREHEILNELLGQRLFHAARRGAWYQRKALLEEHYMHALAADDGREEGAQRKHWKRIALRTCEEGLRDRECHLIYHHDLQKRIKKLEKSLRVPVREQHDFGHASLVKPFERTVEGIRVRGSRHHQRAGATRTVKPKLVLLHPPGKGPRPSGSTNARAAANAASKPCAYRTTAASAGKATTAKAASCAPCSPSSSTTSSSPTPPTSSKPSTKPARSTSSPTPSTPRACPRSMAVWPTSRTARPSPSSTGSGPTTRPAAPASPASAGTPTLSTTWSRSSAAPRDQLATLCKLMAQEYQQRGGGIPDLFLWRADTTTTTTTSSSSSSSSSSSRGEVMFAEVKSPNDRLSDTQRLWIHVLTGAGIRVELCHAVAREVIDQQ